MGKHLTTDDRKRVRILFFDAGLTKAHIEKVTGYTPSQIAYAISASSAEVQPRSGRPQIRPGPKRIRKRRKPAEPKPKATTETNPTAPEGAGAQGAGGTEQHGTKHGTEARQHGTGHGTEAQQHGTERAADPNAQLLGEADRSNPEAMILETRLEVAPAATGE